MSTATAHQRDIATVTVTRLEGDTVTMSSGWSWCLREQLRGHVDVGAVCDVETIRFSQVVGWRVHGATEWLWRETDADIDRADADFRADIDRRHRETLARHEVDWTAREAALPDWARARLAVYHHHGGQAFKESGWGYELVVCELAALYAADPQLPAEGHIAWDDEPAAVRALAEREGTSGNQHDCALALARAHRAGRDLAGTVAALSPITGDAFYAEAAAERSA